MPAVAIIKLFLRRRLASRLIVGSISLLVVGVTLGCGKPFNVKTHPSLPGSNYAAKGSIDEITVEAHAVTDEDLLYDTFDANLIVAGVLPVRIALTNSGGDVVDLKKSRFEIQTHAGRFKSVEAKKAFKRLISYYGISAYSKSGYQESLEAFVSHSIDLTTPLAAAQSRQGLVFFLVPVEAARQADLTLDIRRLKSKSDQAVSLKLN
jgi:hypothetical protein